MNLEQIGITKEQILELAAQKVFDEVLSEENLYDYGRKLIAERVQKLCEKHLDGSVEKVLSQEMERILHETITPVNIWGERSGAPTTLRDALAQKAREFWDVKVDKDNKPQSYGGRPRHEHLMSRLLNEEFTKAIAENAEAIISAFKAALKADLQAKVAAHIDSFIKLPKK